MLELLRRALARPQPWAALLAIGVGGTLLVPTSASAGGVSVRLIPEASTRVVQGAPFDFVTKIHNDTDEAQLVIIDFTIDRKGGSSPVRFSSFNTSVPAGGSATTTGSATSAQWFKQTGTFQINVIGELIPGSAEIRKVDPLGFTVLPPVVQVPRFDDVTSAAGLTTDMPRSRQCGRWAVGAAWGDVDLDGDLDLYLPRQGAAARLWINDGSGHFIDEANARGVDNPDATGLSAVFGDYDNDGDPDLYVGNLGPNRFFENDGTGHFTDVTTSAGVGGDGISSSASWGDYDGDGLLDLYVANYTQCAAQTPSKDADVLYHNEGDGTFTDRTALLEKDPSSPDDGSTLGAGFEGAWFDYDKDGDLDLLLANDFYGPNPDKNHLWRNDGPAEGGTWLFTDVSVASGMGLKMNTMGIGISDYDQDGDLDVALSNIEDNRLMRNNGDGTFTDVASTARVARPTQRVDEHSVTWGMNFADFNLDTWDDIYTGAGSLKSNPESQPNELFANGSKGKFFDLSAPSGANFDGVTRGTAFADYDHDGRMDVYIANFDHTSMLYRNITPKKHRHWLEIDTVGTKSNHDGCGAWLTLSIGNQQLSRQVFCGSISLGSGSDPTVHFGLGSATSVRKLVINWPSGTRQVVKNLDVDRLDVITEPSAP
jgi:hypothetical protein